MQENVLNLWSWKTAFPLTRRWLRILPSSLCLLHGCAMGFNFQGIHVNWVLRSSLTVAEAQRGANLKRNTICWYTVVMGCVDYWPLFLGWASWEFQLSKCYVVGHNIDWTPLGHSWLLVFFYLNVANSGNL